MDGFTKLGALWLSVSALTSTTFHEVTKTPHDALQEFHLLKSAQPISLATRRCHHTGTNGRYPNGSKSTAPNGPAVKLKIKKLHLKMDCFTKLGNMWLSVWALTSTTFHEVTKTPSWCAKRFSFAQECSTDLFGPTTLSVYEDVWWVSKRPQINQDIFVFGFFFISNNL